MSSNATEVSNSGQLTQFLVYGGITGITLQTSTISVICVSLRLADPKRHRRYWIVASLMLAYNAGSIVLVISFAGLSVFGQSTCLMGYFLANGATHFSLFFFDCFILYKACALAGNNNYIVAASILFLVNRLCWGIADIVVSSCIWGNGACNYNQNVVTGWGYQTADLICDAFSSLVSIGFSSIGWDLGSLASLLLSENVLRSLIIFTVNVVSIYYGTIITDPFALSVSYYFGNLVACVLLNAELLWSDARKMAHERMKFTPEVMSEKTTFMRGTDSERNSAVVRKSIQA